VDGRVVSPAQPEVLRYRPETRAGNTPPRLTEKPRGSPAYPAGALLDSQLTYAPPPPPPATAMMCGTLRRSSGTWRGADQCTPRSAENASHPMSCRCPPVVTWVSQVAYRFPAASTPIPPSIPHSDSDMVPARGPTATGADQLAPPSAEEVK